MSDPAKFSTEETGLLKLIKLMLSKNRESFVYIKDLYKKHKQNPDYAHRKAWAEEYIKKLENDISLIDSMDAKILMSSDSF